MRTRASLPSDATSVCRPCCLSSRTRNPAMSGSSSTTSTRNAPSKAGPRSPCTARPARSFIDDLHPREVVRVFNDVGRDAGLVAGFGAILDLLAQMGDFFEAVGIADTFHTMAELAQLLEIARGHCCLQSVELFGSIFHEGRNEIFEVFRDGDGNGLIGHRTII